MSWNFADSPGFVNNKIAPDAAVFSSEPVFRWAQPGLRHPTIRSLLREKSSRRTGWFGFFSGLFFRQSRLCLEKALNQRRALSAGRHAPKSGQIAR
jgi:hypothetical protein